MSGVLVPDARGAAAPPSHHSTTHIAVTVPPGLDRRSDPSTARSEAARRSPGGDSSGGKSSPHRTSRHDGAIGPRPTQAPPSDETRSLPLDAGRNGQARSTSLGDHLLATPPSPSTGAGGQVQYLLANRHPSHVPVHASQETYSPAPAMPTTGSSTVTHPNASFPPRRSSLTQTMPPPAESQEATLDPADLAVLASMFIPPVVGSSRERSVSSSRQPLPIVRPADIYKRIDEERIKERRRSGSTRRSLESTSSRRTETDSVAASGILETRRSTDSLPRGDDPDRPFQAKAKLDPVTERKSEYGMEALLARPQSLAPPDGESSRNVGGSLVEVDPSEPVRSSLAPSSGTGAPLLPDLGRLSGIEDSLWSGTTIQDRVQAPASKASDPVRAPTTSVPADDRSDPSTSLQHQPSIGFRSAVHQAFDRLSPPPAIDGLPSTPTTEPRRSDTSSTAGISPIIGRRSSGAGGGTTLKESTTRDEEVSAIPEENLGGDDQIPTTSPHHSLVQPFPTAPTLDGAIPPPPPPPPSIKLGHRRDLTIPSPSNSPAKSPHVEHNKLLSEERAAELAIASPIDPATPLSSPDLSQPLSTSSVAKTPTSWTDVVADVATTARETLRPTPSPTTITTTPAHPLVLSTSMKPTRPLSRSVLVEPTGSDEQRPSIPGSKQGLRLQNKVLDLAGKFEAKATASVPEQVKPSYDAAAGLLYEPGASAPARPGISAREISFRPALPGGWVSYAPDLVSDAPSATTEQRPGSEWSGPEPPGQPSASTHPDSVDVDHPLGVPPLTIDPADLSTRQPTPSMMRYEPQRLPVFTPPQDETATGPSVDGLASDDPTTYVPPPAKEDGLASDDPTTYVPPPAKDDLGTPVETAPVDFDVPPTPPPKDTPSTESSPESHSNYFTKPLAPRESRTGQGATANRSDSAPERPPVLPQLSTDTSPHDEESDKLRKEIVRSLILPDMAATATHPTRWDYYQTDSPPGVTDADAADPNRYSSIVPREHDSYRASTRHVSEQGQEAPTSTKGPRPPSPSVDDGSTTPTRDERSRLVDWPDDPVGSKDVSTHLAKPSVEDEERQRRSITHPFSVDSSADATNPIVPQGVPDVPTRQPIHSRSDEDLGTLGIDGDHRSPGMLSTRVDVPTEAETSIRSRGVDQPATVVDSQPDRSPVLTTTDTGLAPATHALLRGSGLGSTGPDDHMATDGHAVQHGAPPRHESGEVLPVEEARTDSLPRPDHPSSLDGHRPTPVEASHGLLSNRPAHLRPPNPAPIATNLAELGNSRGFEPILNPPGYIQSAVLDPSKPDSYPLKLSLKDIFNLETTQERVQAYEAARRHYARRDTGLTLWIATISRSHPHTVGAAVAKGSDYTSARPTGPPPSTIEPLPPIATSLNTTQMPTVPLPYYQQYLHFSDYPPSGGQAASGGSNKTSNHVRPLGPPEGLASPFSIAGGAGASSGGKLSSYQVQAKGKDLLHSAGVLGGKANVAAKGLFSKGKSRWRASGGDH